MIAIPFTTIITHTHNCTYMHTYTQMRKLGLGDEVKELGEAELEALDKKTVEYEITVLEEQLKQMTPNMAAIEEYRRKVWCMVNLASPLSPCSLNPSLLFPSISFHNVLLPSLYCVSHLSSLI